MGRRVAITGLGTVNSLGNDVKAFWPRLKNMESGLGPITNFDASEFPSQVAGEVKDFHPEEQLDKKEIRRMDRFTQFAMVAAMESVRDAGLENWDTETTGVILGNGIGGIDTITSNYAKQLERGTKAIYPLAVPMMIGNIAAGQIAIFMNAHGPCQTIVTACSSGTDAMGAALRIIADGEADIIISGGTEAGVGVFGVGAFCALKALSTSYNDTPEVASRPFDKDRDGFVIGEGAGILVLEELEHAKARGAKIYAELASYGNTCDANHLTAPHPEGIGAAAAMAQAVKKAGLDVTDVDYINAHGTSTPLNDPIETKAIKTTFGEHAYKLKVSSTKSMIGHLLGGSGGAEAVTVCMAIRDQYYPGTRNLESPSEECDLNYLAGKGEDAPMNVALSNSFGFGGHNSVLLFKKYAE